MRNNKNVTFNMEEASTLTVRNQTIDVGGHHSTTPVASSSSLTFAGPASGSATVNTTRVYIENNTNVGTAHRNTLTFSGNLLVNINGVDSASGAYTNLSGRIAMIVDNGAQIATNSADGLNGASAWYIRSGARAGEIFDTRLSVLNGHIDGSYFRVESLLQLGGAGQITRAEDAVSLKLEVRNNGRFEAAGAGIASDALVEVQNGGTLAVGLTDQLTGGRSEAAVLTLNSTTTLAAGSMLELTLFGSQPGEADQIVIGQNGSLVAGGKLVLKIADGVTPVHGTVWSLFSVDEGSAGIADSFDLSGIDTARWDLSNFNAAGNWQVVAIPEPSSYALLGVFAFGSLVVRRLRK